MPTVVFDIRANHDTGVSRYGLSLLAEAAPLVADAAWRLLAVVRPVQESRARAAVAGYDIEVLVCPDDEGFVRRTPWLRQLLRSEQTDLYYTSHYTVDRECPVPFVFTIHDLNRLRFPDFSYTDASFAGRFGADELALLREELAKFNPAEQSRPGEAAFTQYFRALNHDLVGRARRVVTVSNSTARDIRALLGVDDSRLDLVPCAVDTTTFFPRTTAEIEAVASRHGLPGPYLAFVGLAHPNKRFPWLVEQLVTNRHRLPKGSRLVAAGGYAEQAPEVAELLRRLRAEDLVVFAGRVTDDELAALYSGASALVTASVNEGNNLPPLEAMACGSQVIATDIPPLRETLGPAASFYDLTDGEELAKLTVAALTGRLEDRARLHEPQTWADSGRRIVNVLERAMAVHNGGYGPR
ncbi:MAG: glycosyltransferase family 4 protein [Nocardioides sp.]